MHSNADDTGRARRALIATAVLVAVGILIPSAYTVLSLLDVPVRDVDAESVAQLDALGAHHREAARHAFAVRELAASGHRP